MKIIGGDVNGDGKADLLGIKSDGTLWYYQNTGNTAGYFGAPVSIGSGWSAFNRVMLGDTNGDGKADIIATKSDGTLWQALSNLPTSSTFSTTTLIGAGWQSFALLAIGDVNGDGKADALGMKSDNTVWYYQGSGQAKPFSSGSAAGALYSGSYGKPINLMLRSAP